jgi:hypothetical protein
MHLITRVRNTTYIDNFGITFNGYNYDDGASTLTTQRFSFHLPGSSNTVMFDAGGHNTNRTGSTLYTLTEGITEISAFKSSSLNQNSLQVNGVINNTTPSTSARVSGGLALGGRQVGETTYAGGDVYSSYNGIFQHFITLSTKTTDANTQAVFDILKESKNNYAGATLIPDGRVVLAPAGANNVATVSGFPSVPVERCLHPCFNTF